MKIAIYHNLEKGGALNSLINTAKILSKNNTIDIYCHQEIVPKNLFQNIHIYKLKKTTNLFNHLKQIFFELKETNKKIATDINEKEYDLVLIFQCLLTQTPYILKFLKRNTKSIYFLNEPKREFYENTSFDYFSIKKIFIRIIRSLIRLVDLDNTKYAKLIISNSYFSYNKIKKIYNQNSFIVYPGFKTIKPTKTTVKNNNKFVSIGLFSKIKGHTFSLKQLSDQINKITIIGRHSDEYSIIKRVAKKNNVLVNEIATENDKDKIKELKKNTFYLANNENEPFGITTLEASTNGLFVLGKNEGGTCEIIKNGLDGILYPNNIEISRLAVKNLLELKYITYYKTNTIDWNAYVNKLMKIYHKYYA
jgi:glycosyltransferase involved in cell wall biosynthesis